jgi:hypothetical protein
MSGRAKTNSDNEPPQLDPLLQACGGEGENKAAQKVGCARGNRAFELDIENWRLRICNWQLKTNDKFSRTDLQSTLSIFARFRTV